MLYIYIKLKIKVISLKMNQIIRREKENYLRSIKTLKVVVNQLSNQEFVNFKLNKDYYHRNDNTN